MQYPPEPIWTTDFNPPPVTTPQQPQNLLRPTQIGFLGESEELTAEELARRLKPSNTGWLVVGGFCIFLLGCMVGASTAGMGTSYGHG
jgi:hypothetical protein